MFAGWKITNIFDAPMPCELDTVDGPYNKTGYRLEHREDGFAITVGLMEYISGWSGWRYFAGLTKNKRYQGDTTMKTEEQREHNQELACLVDDIAFSVNSVGRKVQLP